jgi:outer membrane protein assembly factor BamB
VYGGGLVYIATGFQVPSLMAVRVDGRGDVTRTHVAWTLARGAPYTPSPLLVGEELYYLSDTGVLSCVDAKTGEMRFQQRLVGNFSASPVFADGRIYVLSEEGVTTVLAPGRQFKALATSRLDGRTLASMAIADAAIFVRSSTSLYRISTRQ